ncbi:putative inactive purple acid phosphatase 16 [Camellia lanceoleosa]|uniref:Inactive purple acid phosphatase 16 n=1 Tax=Camellia lanceoleosa TaxID=1840588 RepID=A0ACC0GSY8_9ERIC|nr:putative inactive purple acid phosphatase 16 [Camellia lanceoleosa]
MSSETVFVEYQKGINGLDKVVLREVRGSSVESELHTLGLLKLIGLWGKPTANMRSLEFGYKILVLFSLLIMGKADIYIVTVEGEPVISYRGGVDGFEAFVVDSMRRLMLPGEQHCSFRGTRRLELMRNEIAHNTLSYSRAGPKELWPSISNYVLQLSSSNDSKSPWHSHTLLIRWWYLSEVVSRSQ